MSKWTLDIEQLTSDEFDIHIKKHDLRLAFVGMSNSGKSYRSRVLHNELDFYWHQVDAEIQKYLGFSDMEEVSTWLGYPGSDGYKEREKKYLEAEEATTMLDSLDVDGKNLVFDTTGSVIYLSSRTQNWLRSDCLIVHIDVGETSLDALITKFFKAPKPVIWNDTYDCIRGETKESALKRCYSQLLNDRLVTYQSLAHVNISVEELRDTTGEETLACIGRHLP